jgi:hypothetical protein
LRTPFIATPVLPRWVNTKGPHRCGPWYFWW